jgi:hypothetical protein
MTRTKVKPPVLSGIAGIIILVFGIMVVGCSQSVGEIAGPVAKENSGSDYATFKTEKAEWETNAVTDYYLTLAHANGSASYTTVSIVRDDTPEYVETGGVSVALTDNFPFPPLAQTIQKIYEILEDEFSKNASVEVVFDTQSHTPISVTVKNHKGSGKDYILTIVDFTIAAKGDEPLDASSGEYKEIEEFDMDQFRAEKDAWLSQNIQNYQFISTAFLNFPTVPVLISVSPNADPKLECPPGFSKTEFEQAKERELLITFGNTIEEIYSKIEYLIREEALQYVSEDPANSVKIRITYNAECHYPEYFSMFNYHADKMLIGGGIAFKISGFERLD